MINRPTLPPKRGYVEVEVDGVRLYKNAVTGVLERDETPSTESDLLDMTVDQEFRLTLLELGVI
jgi:hypothetical protein